MGFFRSQIKLVESSRIGWCEFGKLHMIYRYTVWKFGHPITLPPGKGGGEFMIEKPEIEIIYSRDPG